MSDAEYLRSEAPLFLNIARLLSDRIAAEELRSKALDISCVPRN